MYSLGIDIAHDKFDICLYDTKLNVDILKGTFSNEVDGFKFCEEEIIAKDIKLKNVTAFIESTGGLEEPVFEYFRNKMAVVYILNAKQVKRFKESLAIDNKTDSIDAKALARMIVLPNLQNSLKTHKNPFIQQLTDHITQREFLLKERTKVILRRHRLNKIRGNNFDRCLDKQLSELILYFEKQIDELEDKIYEFIKLDKDLYNNFNRLRKLPGIGKVTALTLLEFLGADGKAFKSAEKFAAYAGLYPTECQSGKWVGQKRLTVKGCRRLRRVLYLSAMSTTARPGKWRNYYCEKIRQGKKPMQILMAIANRMARLAWTIIYNNSVFDDNKFLPQYA